MMPYPIRSEFGHASIMSLFVLDNHACDKMLSSVRTVAEANAPILRLLYMPSAQDKARLENPLSQAPKQQSSSTPPRWLRRGSSSLGIKPSSTLLNCSNSWSTVEAIHFSASSYRGAAMPSGTKFPNSPPWSGKASHLLIPSTNSMTVQATATSTRASGMLCYVFPN